MIWGERREHRGKYNEYKQNKRKEETCENVGGIKLSRSAGKRKTRRIDFVEWLCRIGSKVQMYARKKKKKIERENKNFTCVVEVEGEKKREKKMNTLVWNRKHKLWGQSVKNLSVSYAKGEGVSRMNGYRQKRGHYGAKIPIRLCQKRTRWRKGELTRVEKQSRIEKNYERGCGTRVGIREK